VRGGDKVNVVPGLDFGADAIYNLLQRGCEPAVREERGRKVTLHVKALVFDVFGTVVDWRSTVIAEGEALGRAKGLQVDWPSFADEWRREGYHGTIQRIRSEELPWMSVDEMLRAKLDELLRRYNVVGLTNDEIAHFNRVWHRLTPWPDSVAGLSRLKRRYIISTLSNGGFALLTNMARHTGLPWDCIISAELTRKYKPDPDVYLSAPSLLDLQPGDVMLVAAHGSDLLGARAAGLRTGFVGRPLEWGPGGQADLGPDPNFDVTATDFLELADRLGT